MPTTAVEVALTRFVGPALACPVCGGGALAATPSAGGESAALACPVCGLAGVVTARTFGGGALAATMYLTSNGR